jgi:hypothetical protein
MTAAVHRREAWRGAELLRTLLEGERPPSRYAGFCVGGSAPSFGLDAAVDAGSWPIKDGADLPTFLLCVGAAAHAAGWQSVIEGEKLRRLAAAVSASLLEAALALDAVALPSLALDPAKTLDCEALAEIGRDILVASLSGPAGIELAMDPAQARLAVDVGAVLFHRLGGPHA